MKNPYESNDVYEVVSFLNKDEWRNGRKNGIGGSDAAASLGMSKWMTNVDLWRIKTGRVEQADLSDNPAVQYGVLAEEPLRRLYELGYADKYELFYRPDTIVVNKKDEYMRYSPDALLIERETGRLGIWECKTSVMYKSDSKLWKSEIPREYYIQVLHGMNVTGAEFVELQAEINHFGWYERKVFHIERSEVLDDLEYEKNGIKQFMKYIESDTEPPLWIN